jgi:hypothetical protein
VKDYHFDAMPTQLDAIFVKVGSFRLKCANFRLTPEVKAKSTGRLAFNPRVCMRG